MARNSKVITLSNVKELSKDRSPVIRRRVTGSNSVPRYELCVNLTFELSNGHELHLSKGFIWDLSSVPRILWGILPPDGDFEIPSLIHDALYVTKKSVYSRKFADDEMLIWSKATSGTVNKISIRNFDNYVRYLGVRLFGWIVWNEKNKINHGKVRKNN